MEDESVNGEDTHTELDSSQKPTMTYISQLTDNTVEANSSGYHFFNDETDRTNFVGLNVGKYVLELTGTGSSWSFLGFHLPSSSITSANQEIFIDDTYPGTEVETTTTIGGLSYTFYSGKVEIEVTGDFGMIEMKNNYTFRNIVFERTAPRYETIQFEAGWEFFGVLDLKVAMTLNLKDETEYIYKYKSTDDGYETTTSNTMKLNTGNASYWLKSSNTNQVSLLVDYTLHNEVTYDSGHEVTIPVKEGVNVFGTLIKKMTLSASNDESLINKNSLLKYDSLQRRYSSVSYAEELDNKVGYTIEAYSSGDIKAVIS